ncbi:hypothetical protein V1515DRAFT_614332 [Lipomyces mesembrius]
MTDQQTTERRSSPLEIESLPSSTGVEEISKAEEFKYLFFSALVREIDAESEHATGKTIAILQCSGRGQRLRICTMILSASLRRGIQKSAAAFDLSFRYTKEKSTRYQDDSGDLEVAQPRTNKRKVCIRSQLQDTKEELDSTEPSYKRQLLEKHRCCVKSCTNNGNTCFVRGQRHFLISAKHLNDWNESIKVPVILGYADRPLAHPPSAPYPQLPPQYWHQSASYPPPPANYYYSFIHTITVLFLRQLKMQLLRQTQQLHLQLPI